MPLIEYLKNKVNTYIDLWALEDLEYRVKLILKEREELKGLERKELKLAGLGF